MHVCTIRGEHAEGVVFLVASQGSSTLSYDEYSSVRFLISMRHCAMTVRRATRVSVGGPHAVAWAKGYLMCIYMSCTYMYAMT